LSFEEDTSTLALPTAETSSVIETEALLYVCGYVAGRFRQKYPKLGTQVMQQSAASMGNYSWISLLSKGNLLHPCEELVSAAKIMERVFQNARIWIVQKTIGFSEIERTNCRMSWQFNDT
jgi:hypothetical protein